MGVQSSKQNFANIPNPSSLHGLAYSNFNAGDPSNPGGPRDVPGSNNGAPNNHEGVSNNASSHGSLGTGGSTVPGISSVEGGSTACVSGSGGTGTGTTATTIAAKLNHELSEVSLVPTVFKWTFGGNHCFITGSWDAWSTKIPLTPVGHEFTAFVSLSPGKFTYKFVCDGEWRHAPDQPIERDQHGNINNVIEVQHFVSEFDLPGPPSGVEPPNSPIDSYDFSMPAPEEYGMDPPIVPPHYRTVGVMEKNTTVSVQSSQQSNSSSGAGPAGSGGATTAGAASLVAGSGNTASRPGIPSDKFSNAQVNAEQMTGCLVEHSESLPVPNYVCLNHLYSVEKDKTHSSVVASAMTCRYRQKYVTTLLYAHR